MNYCKSLLCSMFNEQTCSRFTRLFVCLVSRSSPCPEYLIKPYNAIFLKSPGSKDIKTDIPNCQIHKYKFTNTQIQRLKKCQEYKTYEKVCKLATQIVPQRNCICLHWRVFSFWKVVFGTEMSK